MQLTLQERAEIAKAVWPDTSSVYILNRAALVADVERGVPCHALTCMSLADRQAIEREIEKRKAVRT